MDTENPEEILKKLQNARDYFLGANNDNTPESDLLNMQVNIFASNYFHAVTEIKQTNTTSLLETYTTYLKSRYSPTRYLLESYLTFAHFLAKPSEQRSILAYNFLLSGKLSIHKIDIKLHTFATLNKLQVGETEAKLDTNRRNYKLMIERWGKIDVKMPDEIDYFFEGNEIIKNANKLFGIQRLNNSKINYSDEIQNNLLISDLLRRIFAFQYPLLSLEAHPTPASLIDFEVFIGKTIQDKKDIAVKRNDATKIMLKVLGESMLKLSRP